jgi:hypothetical protein
MGWATGGIDTEWDMDSDSGMVSGGLSCFDESPSKGLEEGVKVDAREFSDVTAKPWGWG